MGTSLAVACVLMIGVGHGQLDWKRYKLEDCLTASFPKAPTREILNRGSQEVHRYTSLFGMGVYRVAAYEDSSSESQRVAEELKADPSSPVVRGMLRSMVDACNGELKGKVSDRQFGGFKGLPMERCRIETPHVIVYVAAVCSEKRFVCLLAAQPRGAEDLGRVQRFFDSVEL